MKLKHLILSLLVLSLFLISNIVLISAQGQSPVNDGSQVLSYLVNSNDNNSTTINDSSGNNNYGTLNNIRFDSGTGILNDGSLYFNGVNSSVTIPTSNLFNFGNTTNFSISFWFKINGNPSANEFIFAKDGSGASNSWDVLISSNCRLNLRAGESNGLQSIQSYCDNQWHYVVMTVIRNVSRNIYVDGLLDNTGGNEDLNISSTRVPYIGMRSTGNYFNGSLDEFIIYNKSLSINEIENNFYRYGSCINITHKLPLSGYIKTCSGESNYNEGLLLVFNNSYINLTGTHFKGNGSIGLLNLYKANNITIDGLNATNYSYAIYVSNVSNSLIKNSFIETKFNGHMLIDNVVNFTIKDSIFGGINDYPSVIGLYFRYSATNLLINNITYNGCSTKCIKFYNLTGNNVTLQNSNFQGSASMFIQSIGSTGISFLNNYFNDSINNYDSYNVAFNFLKDPISTNKNQNMFISGNIFNNIGCTSILVQGMDNSLIYNNTFYYNQSYMLQNNVNCEYEAPSAIALVSSWKSWTSDSLESSSDNFTRLLLYSSINVSINQNNISGYPVLLVASAPINLTQDLTNYYKYSFASPNYLMPRQDYYVSNDFENISTTYAYHNNDPVVLRDLLGTGYMGSTNTIQWIFKIHKSYLFFQNLNGTYGNITTVFNQSNALLIFSNGTSSINSGDINISLNGGNWSKIWDNYSITYGVNLSDPIYDGAYFINNTTNNQLTVPFYSNRSVKFTWSNGTKKEYYGQVAINLTLNPSQSITLSNLTVLNIHKIILQNSKIIKLNSGRIIIQ